MQNVSEALAEAARQEPDLAPYYELNRTLLELQNEAQEEITATLEMADEEALQSRLVQGLPLVSFAQLPIEAARFAKLATEIAQELIKYNVEAGDRTLPTDDAEWISLAQQRFEAGQVVEGKKKEPQEVEATLAQMAVDVALKSYLMWASDRVMAHVPQEHWRRGYCPVCGGNPDFGTLDTEAGTRRLMCSRCNSQWLYRRVGCPFCNTTTNAKLAYYPSEDNVYRLYVCQECKHYLKAIDLRETNRAVLLPVERITTVAMDAAAQQEGYLG
ncbi:MAG: formate dehydrogenase accessory protein FdhE [Chloroflexi bacterium]|nr:formate dehydrogenase accessory protein FdhE [Chloroflexota bacterium]